MAAKDIEVKVKYIPDTSALKSAMNGMSGIDFKAGNSNVKKELVAPVQAAMKEVNKALASGADSSTLLQLFQKVGKEADAAKTKASAMLSELNTVFNSSGNQKLLKDLEEYRKKISQTEKQIENWDKKFGNATMKQMKTDLYGTGKGGVAEARKEIASMEEQVKIGKQLTQQDEERLALLKKYVSTWNERQATTPKNELEGQLSGYKAKESDILSQVQTPAQNVDETKRLTAIITQMGSAYGLSTQEVNKLSAALKVQDEVIKKNKKELTKFGDIITGTFLGTSIGNLFQTGMQRGIQFFKEYDETLTRTMMVTGMVREEVNGLTSSYNKLANQLSSTTKDVAAAQLVFYQQGLGTKEALDMTEASIAISKTGGIEAGEAANRLTAAVRGYQLAASDAMNIADKMSALDAAAASSVDELTIAMQKSASQARMAGLDLDYYMAYLSTMQEVTREAPENIGTAMKSITARIQEIRDIGKIEEDGTTFSNVAKALNSIGIAATDSSGQLRSLQDIMNELGPMWATLDRNHKAYIATTLAGNRQQSRFIALMDNYDRAMELVNVSQNASGESAKQLRAYNQGLEASFTALSNAWQQFATKLADSEVIKDVVDLLTDIIKLFNKLPKGITSTLIPMAALAKIFTTLSKAGNLFKGFKDWGIEKLGFDKFLDPIDQADSKINKLGKTVSNFVKDSVSKLDEVTISFKQNTQGAEDTAEAVNKIEDTAIGASVATTQLNTNKAATAGIIASESKITDNYKEVAGKAAENIGKMGTEIANNKDIMDSNDATMDKEIKDTARLGTVTEEIRLKKEKAQARSAIGLEKQTQVDMRNQYKSDIDRLVADYKNSNSKEYNKVIGRYKASQTRAKNKALASGQQELPIDGNEWENLNVYLGNKIPALGKKMEEVTAVYQEELNSSNRFIAAQEEYSKEMDEALRALKIKTSNTKKAAEADIKETDASNQAAEADLNEANASNNATQADNLEASTPNIDTNGIDLDFWGKDAKGLEKLGADYKGSKGLEGLSFKLGEVRKQFSMTSIMSSVMIGSFAKMGASAIGLGDDLSSAIGTFAGFANQLKGFGPAGLIVAAAISAIKFGLDKAFPSVEKMKEKLNELQLKQDELKQKETDISGYLDTYNELSGKLNRTTEETEELNAATEALAATLPNVVTGYDQYGNALIDTTRAMQELQAVQAQQAETASKTLDQYGELQRGAQNAQKTATIWTTLAGTLLTIAGVAGTVLSLGTLTIPSSALTATGIALLTGSAASGIEMSVSQKNENKKVIEENYNDIYAQLLTVEGQLVDKMAKEHQGIGDQILKTLATSMLEAGRTTGEVYADEIDDMLIEIAGQLNSSTLNKIQNTLNSLEISMDVKEMNYDEARDYVLDRIKDELEKAGFEGEELEAVVNVILNVKFDATIEIEEARKTIQAEIEKSLIGDNDYRVDLDRFGQAIGQLDEGTLKAMRDLGLLDVKFAEVYTNIEDNGFADNKDIGITEMFRNANGEIDETIGALRTYEIALGKISKMEEMQNYESGIGYAQSMALQFEGQIENLKAQGIIAADTTWEDLFGEDKLITMGKWAAEWERSGEGLKYWKEVADKAYAAMDSKLLPTFKEVSEVLKETKESFDALNSVAEHLDETNGKLDVDGLTGLFDLFGMFEDSAMNNADSWNAWMTALTAVNNGISYENGLLKLNEEAMSGVATMVHEATKAKYQKMVADINEAQTSLKLQRDVLSAELQAVSTQITALETLGKANYDEATFESDTKETLAANLDAINMGQIQSEEEKVQKILEINQAGFNQLLAMQKQYAKGENASFTLKDYSGEYKKAVNKFKKDREDNLLSFITDDYDETLAGLKKYQAALTEQISILDGKILQGDVEKKFFQDVIDGKIDLGKAMSMNGAEDSVKDYNEQLKRTLTLLEKIEGLQHTIEENNAFKSLYEGYDGESYGRLMMSNLKLAQEQYDVYKDLFEMQQEMTNQAAGDLLDSPYGQMFNIAKNGDIGWADDSMYDKYKALPEDMQEDIDNLVEAYQTQRDELRETEQSLTKYAQAVKEAREELVEMEIEIENELVDALKNREKIMHDARVKAIDDEIDMIEKAVEARKKARDEDESEKELYSAQEALRRATLDSSGKNNAKLLQLQQDLEDKQLEISEKRFEDDMEDRKNWLQDTKDAETETYEYRLEKMTWYWENVQIIQEAGQEEMMQTLIHWNEEYRTTSQLQQSEMLREWQFTMDAMKTASDMGAELGQLTNDIVSVTTEVESMNISIEKLPGAWEKATDAANRYSNAASNAGKAGNFVTGGIDNTSNTGDGSTNPNTEVNEYIGWVGKTLEFRADNKSIDTYNSDGTKTRKKAKDPLGYDPNVKIKGSKKINGEYMFLTDKWTGYVPVKYFYETGIGGKKISKSYLYGGYVDYTGPAWVDGTSSKPEAFLSAYQTQQIGALAEALDSKSINSANMNSNVTFGSINFNVASMSSAADGKKALEMFVQGANELMAKKGIGTKLNMNVK